MAFSINLELLFLLGTKSKLSLSDKWSDNKVLIDPFTFSHIESVPFYLSWIGSFCSDTIFGVFIPLTDHACLIQFLSTFRGTQQQKIKRCAILFLKINVLNSRTTQRPFDPRIHVVSPFSNPIHPLSSLLISL